MKSLLKPILYSLLLLASCRQYAQHTTNLWVKVDAKNHTLQVTQQLQYFNQTNDTISSVVLNDWNNAYSDKNSLLGKRFSDEFVRNFQMAKDSERGYTKDFKVTDGDNVVLEWHRPKEQVDLIEIPLSRKILPQEKREFRLTYVVTLPSNRFTRYGYADNGAMTLKNWYLIPARYENHNFTHYSNADLDDIANGIADYTVTLEVPDGYQLHSDLNQISAVKKDAKTTYELSGKSRVDFSLFIEPKPEFYSYKNNDLEVVTNLKAPKINDIQKALIIDRVADYVQENLGDYPYEKISVSQVDYDRNPFYGLNQLPSFINVFGEDFLFELKFIKTYTNNYLKNTLHLDPRKDGWIYDGIQVYLMMKYIEDFHPDKKLMGGLAKFRLLKGFNAINLDFNEQYSYYYLLMARKNLDQPLRNSKETLIRFNEKIASKYRAGISLKYLDHYLQDSIVPKAIRTFYEANKDKATTAEAFENELRNSTPRNIDWFFKTIIGTRDIIDYTFEDVSKTEDSVTFTIKNKTGTNVPVPVYGIKNKQIVFKKWFENIRKDSVFTLPRNGADKIVLNYENEVPEFNRRNNWKSLKGFLSPNRPYKFVFLKDLEDSRYNQILFVPTIGYNFYDGLTPGLRFHNKTLLAKPFNYDINPVFSTKTGQMRGRLSFLINQYNRDSRWYYTRYALNSSYFNYAPDASYFKINPNITFNIRENDFRDNRKEGFILKYNVVQKQESKMVVDSNIKNYSIFGLKYFNYKTELVSHFNFLNDIQFSNTFGKASGEIQYRRLFNNNRRIDIRLYAGTFLYNKDTNAESFNFGLTSINDYQFEQELLGRSEKSGIFSQQFIMGEGGFKSKVLPPSVNQWLVTTNMSFNVWNWIEIYGDLGVVKNHGFGEKWVYDNGVRLNLVTDYLEFYFPVYSNNGWEIAQPQYSEKIRIVLTLDPKILVNLFTRKWF